MDSRNHVNNVVLSAITQTEEMIEPKVVEEYSKLKEKCDKVITKIKNRKSKKSLNPPPISTNTVNK